MENNLEGIFYTKENYWFSIENDIITVGLTEFILDDINIINYVELPVIGSLCSQTEVVGQLNFDDDENLDIYSLFTGKITDINSALMDNGEQLFSHDRENSWLYRMTATSKAELEEEFMTKKEYEEYIENMKG